MSTTESDYEKIEREFIFWAQKLKENYNINNKELYAILEDN